MCRAIAILRYEEEGLAAAHTLLALWAADEGAYDDTNSSTVPSTIAACNMPSRRSVLRTGTTGSSVYTIT